MTPKELKDRTDVFSKRVVTFCTPLLVNPRTNELADQLLRSGTAVDANYGSAQRGRSNKEFIAKLGQALDDASESVGWLSKLEHQGVVPKTEAMEWLMKEADELTRILARSYATADANRKKREAETQRQKRKRRRR